MKTIHCTSCSMEFKVANSDSQYVNQCPSCGEGSKKLGVITE